MTYLDTHIAAELAQSDYRRLSAAASKILDREQDLRISPMVFFEVQYLYEIGRLAISAEEILRRNAQDLNVRICDASFAQIARQALAEGWTRDPFDRMIVAHARMHKARLITRDQRIHQQYRLALG